MDHKQKEIIINMIISQWLAFVTSSSTRGPREGI